MGLRGCKSVGAGCGSHRHQSTGLARPALPPLAEPLERRTLFAAGISVSIDGTNIADGAAAPALSNTSDPRNLGQVIVGQGQSPKVAVITNTGDETLSVGPVVATTGFEVLPEDPAQSPRPDVIGLGETATVEPGETATFRFRLTAVAQGPQSGTVSFATNVPGLATFDFGAAGEVVPEPAGLEIGPLDAAPFVDNNSVTLSQGKDGDGNFLSFPGNRVFRFTLAAAQNRVTVRAKGQNAEGNSATGDMLLIVTADTVNDAADRLDQAEVAAAAISLPVPSDDQDRSDTQTLPAGDYFVRLSMTNFQTSQSSGTVGAEVDYQLSLSAEAVAPADVAVRFADNNTAVADGDTSPSAGEGTAFGGVQVGQAGPVRQFTVTNNGDSPLTLGALQIAGDGFEVVEGLRGTIAPHDSDSFSIQLLTDAPGDRSAQVSFTTNVAGKNPYNFAIAGSVAAPAAPEVSVLADGSALADGQSAAVAFGSVVAGQAGPTKTFTVRNNGTAPLTLGAVSVPAGFSLVEPLSGPLAPGASDTFVVRLDSSGAAGAHAGAVSFATNDADENPFNFNVSGAVTEPPPTPAPEVSVSADGSSLSDGQATPVNFGSVAAGQAGPTRTFTVRNDGNATLTLGAVGVPAGFTLTEPLAGSLAPGASDTFTVRLDTAGAGSRSGAVRFTSNDADEATFDIPVAGTVTAAGGGVTPAPEITVLLGDAELSAGQAVDFGSVERGAAAGPVRTFTVRNDGTDTLSLGAPSLPAGFTLVEGLPAALAPGAADTFQVAVSTASAGTFAGTLTVPSDDADEGAFAVSLSAVVTEPTVSAPPGPVAVEAVGGKLPASLVPGDKKAKASVSVALRNTTDQDFAGPVTVTLYASGDGSTDPATATVLQSLTKNQKLKAGAAGKPVAFKKVPFPSSLPDGTYVVFAVADAGGARSAAKAGPSVNVSQPFVRLTGPSGPVTLPKPAKAGKAAAASVLLANAGNVAAKGGLGVEVRVAPAGGGGGSFEAATPLGATAGKLNLKPGAARAVKLKVPLGSLAAGTYTLLLRLTPTALAGSPDLRGGPLDVQLVVTVV